MSKPLPKSIKTPKLYLPLSIEEVISSISSKRADEVDLQGRKPY